MKSYSNQKPSVLEKCYGERYLYHYNIVEVEVSDEDGNISTQWEYDEVEVFAPLSRDKILRLVINATWDKDAEQKLINEYNAYKLKVSTDKTALTNYTDFLTSRQSLKEQVYADWEVIK